MALRTDVLGFRALDWLGLLVYQVLSHGAGALGAADTRRAARSEWYQKLKRAPLDPPNWLFGIVWPMLYTLMGVAAFLIWQDNGVANIVCYNASLALWIVMLVSNAVWSPLFFGAQQFLLALLDLVLHLLLAVAVCVLFFLQYWVAGALMIPLCIWLMFAFYLNLYVVLYNNNSGGRHRMQREDGPNI
jgi:benzodiazapine receptor